MGKNRGVATQSSSDNHDNIINKGALDKDGLQSSTTGRGLYGASKENPIRRYRIESHNNGEDLSTPSRFFGMSKESALDMFGLA